MTCKLFLPFLCNTFLYNFFVFAVGADIISCITQASSNSQSICLNEWNAGITDVHPCPAVSICKQLSLAKIHGTNTVSKLPVKQSDIPVN